MECSQFIVAEYFKIFDVINTYDDRIMIIKGWAITFSLALIGYGFEKKISALFWLSAISALCFFVMDVTFKGYQSSYYPRMSYIEDSCKHFVSDESDEGLDVGSIVTMPLGINNSWHDAHAQEGLVKTATSKLNVWLPYLLPMLFGLGLGIASLKYERFIKFMANKPSEKDAPKSLSS